MVKLNYSTLLNIAEPKTNDNEHKYAFNLVIFLNIAFFGLIFVFINKQKRKKGSFPHYRKYWEDWIVSSVGEVWSEGCITGHINHINKANKKQRRQQSYNTSNNINII
jgi:hypothetical protein